MMMKGFFFPHNFLSRVEIVAIEAFLLSFSTPSSQGPTFKMADTTEEQKKAVLPFLQVSSEQRWSGRRAREDEHRIRSRC